jgi:hypothetical protein
MRFARPSVSVWAAPSGWVMTEETNTVTPDGLPIGNSDGRGYPHRASAAPRPHRRRPQAAALVTGFPFSRRPSHQFLLSSKNAKGVKAGLLWAAPRRLFPASHWLQCSRANNLILFTHMHCACFQVEFFYIVLKAGGSHNVYMYATLTNVSWTVSRNLPARLRLSSVAQTLSSMFSDLQRSCRTGYGTRPM